MNNPLYVRGAESGGSNNPNSGPMTRGRTRALEHGLGSAIDTTKTSGTSSSASKRSTKSTKSTKPSSRAPSPHVGDGRRRVTTKTNGTSSSASKRSAKPEKPTKRTQPMKNSPAPSPRVGDAGGADDTDDDGTEAPAFSDSSSSEVEGAAVPQVPLYILVTSKMEKSTEPLDELIEKRCAERRNRAGVGKSVAVFVVGRAMQREARTFTKRANMNEGWTSWAEPKKNSKIKSHLEGMIVTAALRAALEGAEADKAASEAKLELSEAKLELSEADKAALRAALDGAEAERDGEKARADGAEHALAGAEAQLDRLRREAQDAGTCCSFVICCIVVDWPVDRRG
jgi:hypothetical protein